MKEENQEILTANRDPTEKDDPFRIKYWVSLEYIPYRIFKYYNSQWKFIGKFYPTEKE
jgi:hypothetical protein